MEINSMSKELVANWFAKISEVEKDLPLLLSDGYAYTPRMAYTEVMNGSSLGAKLQALIESGRFGTSSLEETAIAKVRIQQIMRSKPQDKVLFATMSNKTFTPAQLLQEIESGTQIGEQWVQSEISRMTSITRIR
jgi:hypothetical protein